MSTWQGNVLRGNRASQPAAASVVVGAIYFVTDEGVTERSTGAAWESYSPTTVGGNVTAAGTLTNNALVIGQGSKATATTTTAAGILTFLGTPSSANLAAALTDETGSGAAVFGTSPTITTPTISGAMVLPDNVRQTFNPGADAAGLNVGAVASDPGTPVNGDLWYDSTANELTARINGASVSLGAAAVSTIVQVVNVQSGAVATGSTVIPIDDTIPQNTEGDEYMTLAITPTDAAHKLRIDVVFQSSCDTGSRAVSAALFQDTTADALAAIQEWYLTGGGSGIVTFSHWMTAGTTSATTFKLRAGPNAAATITFNGGAGARQFGGVMASSMTITEIVP
jgi:hypothetical protein